MCAYRMLQRNCALQPVASTKLRTASTGATLLNPLHGRDLGRDVRRLPECRQFSVAIVAVMYAATCHAE